MYGADADPSQFFFVSASVSRTKFFVRQTVIVVQMFCAISGQVPEEPVVSVKSGHVFEKRLIEKALTATGGKCPETNVDLSEEDLIPLKFSGHVAKPAPASATSFPGLLSHLKNEWDAVMLETHKLKKGLQSVKQELAHALYQYDAARRVIANLISERDHARKLLAERGVDRSGAEQHNGLTDGQIIAKGGGSIDMEVVQGEKDAGNDGEKDGEKPSGMLAEKENDRTSAEKKDKNAASELPARLLDQIKESNKKLRRKRRERRSPKTLASRDEIKRYKGSTDLLVSEAQSPICSLISTASTLMAGCGDGSIYIVDSKERSVVGSTIDAHDEEVRFLALSPTNENRILSAGADRKIRMWYRETLMGKEAHTPRKRRRLSRGKKKGGEKFLFQIEDLEGEVVAMNFNPSGCLALVALQNGMWKLYDPADGRMMTSKSDDASYTAGAFHPDGILFGLGTDSGLVNIWDSTSMKKAVTLGEELEKKGKISDMAMSENGYSLVTCIESQDIVRVWDLRKQAVAHEYSMPSDSGSMRCALDSFGAYTAAIGSKGIDIFGTKRGQQLANFRNMDLSVTNIAWGVDAKWLAASRTDGTLQFYNVTPNSH